MSSLYICEANFFRIFHKNGIVNAKVWGALKGHLGTWKYFWPHLWHLGTLLRARNDFFLVRKSVTNLKDPQKIAKKANFKGPKRSLRDIKNYLTPYLASRDPVESAKWFFSFFGWEKIFLTPCWKCRKKPYFEGP